MFSITPATLIVIFSKLQGRSPWRLLAGGGKPAAGCLCAGAWHLRHRFCGLGTEHAGMEVGVENPAE